MHELGIAMEIAELAASRVSDGERVTRVVIEVGALTAVLPDALAFAWDTVIEDSTMAGATLEIVPIAGRGRCSACRAEHAMHVPFGRCSCGKDLEIVDGEQLRIRNLEVATHVRDMRVLG